MKTRLKVMFSWWGWLSASLAIACLLVAFAASVVGLYELSASLLPCALALGLLAALSVLVEMTKGDS